MSETRTLRSEFKRARWDVEEQYPDVDDEFGATALEAADTIEKALAKRGILDLVPITGTQYAVPKERIEAACDAGWPCTSFTSSNMTDYVSREEQREIVAAVLCAVLGEVLPVEAVVTLNPQEDGSVWVASTVKGVGWDAIMRRRLGVISDAGKEAR